MVATAPDIEPDPGTASPAVTPPPGSPRFALVDSLRAFAVLGVLVNHVAAITGEVNRPTFGQVFPVLSNQALTLFFLVSGFLLYRPFVAARRRGRPSPGVARYARRRALRIAPAYWTALTVLALYPGVVGAFSGDWWRYYLLAQGYWTRTVGGGIPSAWSLTAEVGFYIALPVWALLVRRVGARLAPDRWLRTEVVGLAAVAAAGIAVQVAASRLLISDLFVTTLPGESVWFALGMALAVASVAEEGRERPSVAGRLVADHPGLCWLGALACLIGAVLVLHPGGVFNIVLSLRTRQPIARTLGSIALTAGCCALVAAPAVFGTRAGGTARRLLAWRPLALLGLISYGVYLYHLTVAELLWESHDPFHFSAAGLGLVDRIRGSHVATLALLAGTLAVSVILAALSYRFVELPFLRRKEPRPQRPTAPAS